MPMEMYSVETGSPNAVFSKNGSQILGESNASLILGGALLKLRTGGGSLALVAYCSMQWITKLDHCCFGHAIDCIRLK